eukprot:4623148-Alexandrium_andersonii.AAC.1
MSWSRAPLAHAPVKRCHCLPRKDARARERSAQQSRAAHMSYARFACTGLGIVLVRARFHARCVR